MVLALISKKETGRTSLCYVSMHLGLDVVWLDLDVYLVQNPTEALLNSTVRADGSLLDVVVTDHVDGLCVNNGVFPKPRDPRHLDSKKKEGYGAIGDGGQAGRPVAKEKVTGLGLPGAGE